MNSVLQILLTCQVAATVNDPFPAVAKAILWQESRGDPNAVGDGGRAIGAYQIHRDYWSDGTRFLGVTWPYSDARDPVKALAVVRAYTEHYVRAAGIEWTAQNIARIHNGGPQGYRKAATRAYWRKIERIMEHGLKPDQE